MWRGRPHTANCPRTTKAEELSDSVPRSQTSTECPSRRSGDDRSERRQPESSSVLDTEQTHLTDKSTVPQLCWRKCEAALCRTLQQPGESSRTLDVTVQGRLQFRRARSRLYCSVEVHGTPGTVTFYWRVSSWFSLVCVSAVFTQGATPLSRAMVADRRRCELGGGSSTESPRKSLRERREQA